ncbi:hypothetical protein Taro_008890 [Colocasia esculenta]|uniref:Uncharacterized protein n=1 Tax=Colocasia esculenta TaxID=4460 RepID=A0A843U8D5_COLES|nr:hypothetical protein [Colocasia esculenta]
MSRLVSLLCLTPLVSAGVVLVLGCQSMVALACVASPPRGVSGVWGGSACRPSTLWRSEVAVLVVRRPSHVVARWSPRVETCFRVVLDSVGFCRSRVYVTTLVGGHGIALFCSIVLFCCFVVPCCRCSSLYSFLVLFPIFGVPAALVGEGLVISTWPCSRGSPPYSLQLGAHRRGSSVSDGLWRQLWRCVLSATVRASVVSYCT